MNFKKEQKKVVQSTIIIVLLFQLLFVRIGGWNWDNLKQHEHDINLQYIIPHNKNVPFTRRTSVFGWTLNSSGPASEGVAPILVLRVIWKKCHYQKRPWRGLYQFHHWNVSKRDSESRKEHYSLVNTCLQEVYLRYFNSPTYCPFCILLGLLPAKYCH